MRISLFLSLAALAFAGDVVQLTPDNFKDEVGNKDIELTLVKFYAPWCGHCKAMAADYEKAATELKDSHPKIKLAEFDADAHRDFATKFNVEGFPTLKVFRHGDLKNPDDYNGPRTVDGIVKSVIKLNRPPFTVVDSAAALKEAADKALADGEIVVTGAFKEAGKDVETFKKWAKKGSKSFTIFVQEAGADERKIVLTAPDTDPVEYTDKKVSSAKLTAFGDKNKFPIYAEISQDNFKAYMDRGLPLGWTFIDPSDEETTAKVAAAVTEVAKQFKGKVSFVYLSGVAYGQMAERVGLSGKSWPAFGLDDTVNKKHYAFTPEGEVPDVEKLTAFVQGALDGALEATVRSEDEPAQQPGEDGVFVLTGNNFVKETVESGKDVMVEFYAPWCGHCKNLAPEYSAVAKAIAGSKNVRVAKMDATANDIPHKDFDVSGYPTLYFVKAGADGAAGTVQSYNGGRTKSDILNYIKEHATNEVVVDDE